MFAALVGCALAYPGYYNTDNNEEYGQALQNIQYGGYEKAQAEHKEEEHKEDYYVSSAH